MLRTNNWSNEKIKCCQNLSFLCTNAKQKNGGGVTEERVALLLWQAKGEHSRLVPQEPVPSFWSVGRGYIDRQEYVIRNKAVTALYFLLLLTR